MKRLCPDPACGADISTSAQLDAHERDVRFDAMRRSRA